MNFTAVKLLLALSTAFNKIDPATLPTWDVSPNQLSKEGTTGGLKYLALQYIN